MLLHSSKPENFAKLRGRVVNFGQGAETTIKEVVETICEEMDYPMQAIDYRPPRLADVQRHFADISLAKELFGYEPQTTLRASIRRTVEWYEQCDLVAQ